MSEPLLTPAQVAERLGVSRNLIYALTKSGRLSCCRITPSTPRYTESQIEDYLASVEVNARVRSIRKTR